MPGLVGGDAWLNSTLRRVSDMEVEDRVRRTGAQLTAAERRVAEVVLERPQLVGFGTVADLAAAAGAGAATVVRLAAKLGFDGFSALQASVQRDLAHQLRPAAERIREIEGDQPIERHRAAELSNVQATVDAVDPVTLDAVVTLLADPQRDVLVLAGDAERGVALQFAADLGALRSGVAMVGGSDVAVRRTLALSAADSHARRRRPAPLRTLGPRSGRRCPRRRGTRSSPCPTACSPHWR